MPQVINTNIASLNAQRNLDQSQATLNRSLQRLSTGLRINSARDDAAGLAISERFNSQIRGLNQAVRNANDGISLAQTAEGALSESVNSLQRIRELAVQSANATNNSSDRTALNSEVQQLVAEIDRIATQTSFNGNSILATSGGFNATFQVGAGVGQTISVTVQSARTTDIGVASNFGTIQAENTATFAARLRSQFAEDISGTVNGITVTTVAADTNSIQKINALNAVSGQTGLTAFSFGNSLNSASAADDDATSLALASGDIVINGVDVGAVAANTNGGLVAAINALSAQTGVTADASTGTADLILFNNTGAAISITVNTADAATRSGVAQGTTTVAAGDNGAIVLNAALANTAVTFGDAGTGQALTGTSGTSATLSQTTVASININTVSASNIALLAVDQALTSINTIRGTLGAIQNRFDSTISNLTSTAENLSASRSRIVDADFAAETAALTRSQILQQAGISILSQANAQPQNALALLQ
ncbi:MAG: flagellin [Gammaproteobacteria bacterium]